MDITFPWYIYPFLPFSGYTNTKIYIPELLRLNEFISSYNYDKKILLHMTIGSAMEEYNNIFKNTGVTNDMQWKQLFPDHIYNYVIEGGECVMIIISPDESFTNKTFIEPMFIKNTNDIFKWNNINNNHFYSNLYKVKIYIFNTMMPTENNKKHNFQNGDELLIKYTPTHNDLLFVQKFYKNMKSFFVKILKNNGNITCFSFAVFNITTDYSSTIKNFAMFLELLKLRKKNKIIFAEWLYDPTKYILNVMTDKRDKITYNHDDKNRTSKIVIITDVILLK